MTYEDILALNLPNIILYAAPIMFAFVFLEWYLSYRDKKGYYDGKDTLAATIIGIGNLMISSTTKVITFGIILYFYNLTPLRVPLTWWSYILCLIWMDLMRYWSHRITHESRFWWATHVTHHNSEKYNLSVSFRLSWTQHPKIIFYIPIALVGFHPVAFFICHQIEVLYQYWLHTEYIRKLHPAIEYFFTTPSHHRVHHGTNEKYLDKNYGSTLIIWDRLFGTFQAEEEQAYYGITTPVNSYNPIKLNFHEWVDIVRDFRKAKSLKQACQVTFGSPRNRNNLSYSATR